MPSPDDLRWDDATAQAQLVRDGVCSPLELVDAAIGRIEALNPALNAVIHPLFEKARAAAADPDLPDGAFRGVPICIKDAVAHTAGDPYHLGMRFLRDRAWVEQTDAEIVRRFRAAGFVIVGKTNTPELATSDTTEPVAYGATHNPWDITRSPGGSSGGSAAAVAAGMVPVAHGNDMGGSIRVPASACGLVGLKPTRARGTLAPSFGEFWGPLTHEGVLCRSVRDSAGVLDVFAGAAPGDPYNAAPPSRPYAEAIALPPGRLRIGLWSGTDPDPAISRAVADTGALLATLGHDVNDDHPSGLDEDLGDKLMVFPIYVAREVARWEALTGDAITSDDLEPANWLLAELGRTVSAVDYLRLLENIQAWSRRVAAWWAQGFDVLVLPTIPVPIPRLGENSLELMTRITAHTIPFNFTGQPAISLPIGFDEDHVPVGVQLVAATGREDLLLQVAAQLEPAVGWLDRHASFDG